MEVIIGVAAGAAAAALCALSYRKGVKDGIGIKKAAASAGDGGEEAQNELMRKYELIMSYDPYGSSEKSNAFWGVNAPESNKGGRV